MENTNAPHAATHWFSGKVLRGDQIGRTLEFPSANLDANILADIKKEGVYAARVEIDGTEYRGALYIGPRLVLHETKRVLEIHILNFAQEIYGRTIRFTLETFIRPPMNFDTVDELIQRLKQDIVDTETALL